MPTYPVHPAAECFPMIDGPEFEALVADIRANGLIHPIALWRATDGQEFLLDGRNRLKACEAVPIAPRYQEVKTSDPVAYVIAVNLRRRELSKAQRAAIAAELATMGHGGNRRSDDFKTQKCVLKTEMTIPQAAASMNVSPRSVDNAKSEMRDNPEAHEAAKRGDSEALKAARAKRKAEMDAELAGKLQELDDVRAHNKELRDEARRVDQFDPHSRAQKFGIEIATALLGLIKRIEMQRDDDYPFIINPTQLDDIQEHLKTLHAFTEEQKHVHTQRNGTTIHCPGSSRKH